MTKKIPLLAGVLSLLIPGLGQIYNGDGKKGRGDIGSCDYDWEFQPAVCLAVRSGFYGGGS